MYEPHLKVVPAVLCYALMAWAVIALSAQEKARTMEKKRMEQNRLAKEEDKTKRMMQRLLSKQQKAKKRKNKKTKEEHATKTQVIFVRDLGGKTVAIQASTHTTVADLKEAIFKKTNVPAEWQKLLFPAKFATFPDDELLADCSIGCGSTLTLILAAGLRGGMGCGPSKPSGDDGSSAYREEAAVSAKVAAAIATIKKQIVELQEDVDKHGAVPSSELSAEAARQAADAVGSTLCVINSLEQQLAEAKAKVGDWPDSYKDPILKPLERDLDAAKAMLKAALQVCTSKTEPVKLRVHK